MELNILEVCLDGNRGEIKASYYIKYSDSSGKMVYYGSASDTLPSIWILEKQGAKWVIIDIDEHP